MLQRFQSQQQNPQILYRDSNVSYLSQENERMAVRRNFLENVKNQLDESFMTNIGLVGLSIFKIIAVVLVYLFEPIPSSHINNNPTITNDTNTNIIYNNNNYTNTAITSNNNNNNNTNINNSNNVNELIQKSYIYQATEIQLWLCFMVIYDIFNIFYLLYLIFIISKYKSAAQRRGIRENLLGQSQTQLQYQQQLQLQQQFQQQQQQQQIQQQQYQQDQQYPMIDRQYNMSSSYSINIEPINQNNYVYQQQQQSQTQLIESSMTLNMLYEGQQQQQNDNQNDGDYSYLYPRITTNRINFLEYASHQNKILKYCSIISKIVYFILFLFGNYFAYFNKSCSTVFPSHYYIAIWLVALGYFSFGIQILLCLSICLCFPLTLFLYVLMRNRAIASTPAKNEIVQKLVPIKYEEKINSSEFEQQKECCICLVDYQLNDQIISLPCSKMHHYHYDCVVKWLNISGVCPICKQPLEQYFEELEIIDA